MSVPCVALLVLGQLFGHGLQRGTGGGNFVGGAGLHPGALLRGGVITGRRGLADCVGGFAHLRAAGIQIRGGLGRGLRGVGELRVFFDGFRRLGVVRELRQTAGDFIEFAAVVGLAVGVVGQGLLELFVQSRQAP